VQGRQHSGENSRHEQRAGQRADDQRQRQGRQGEQEDEEAPCGTVVCHGDSLIPHGASFSRNVVNHDAHELIDIPDLTVFPNGPNETSA
jgi:hypothetical protein